MQAVQSILKREARKLLLARVLNVAAVGLAGSAVAAAMLQLHWWGLAHGLWKTTAALLIIAGVAGAVVAIGLASFVRLAGLPIRSSTIAAIRQACVLFLLILGGGIAFLPYWASMSAWMFPAIALPVGAAIPAVLAGLVGVSTGQAARHLDACFHLKERATTAEELIRQGRADEPWALCVCSQALAAMESAAVGSHQVAMGRHVPAVAGLAVLLCATMSFLPMPQAPVGPAVAERVVAALPTMSAQQRQQLADVLREAAEKAKDKPAIEANLQRAARAAEDADPETMQKALELLASGGLELRRVIPPEFQSVGGGEKAPTAGNPTTSENVASRSPTNPDSQPPEGSTTDYVRVMNPDYGTVGGADRTSQQSVQTLPWQQAWERARARAIQELDAGQVPSACRAMVKDFFDCR